MTPVDRLLANQALLEALPQPAWLVALASQRVLAVNSAAAALLGQPAAALVGADAQALATSPEDLAWWAEVGFGDVGTLDSDTVIGLTDGRSLPCRRSIRLLAESGREGGVLAPTQALVSLHDRRDELEQRARSDELNAALQATLEATADGILVVDAQGRLRACNRRFVQLWGLPDLVANDNGVADASGVADSARWLAGLTQRVADPLAYAEGLAALRADPHAEAQDTLVLRDGRTLDRVTRPLRIGERVRGRVFCFRDLTERIVAEQRIDCLSCQDALTGLANRAALAERVAKATSACTAVAEGSGRAVEGGGFALLVIDLDRFRQVNDSLGHDSGNAVLRLAADRMQACLRGDDFIARIGGDSFAVMLSGGDANGAETTARRMLGAVAQPCEVGGSPFTLTCSIGIALAPSHGQTLDDLLHHAEAAMRAVKDGGRANVRLHQVRGRGDRRSQIRLDHAMRQALVSNRFRLHYQPQVSLADGRLLGAEALIRWRDPEHGEVPPGRFIPVAEESGFIVAIGDWVLSQAVRQATLWMQRGHPIKIAVNVSALQFQQPQFVERVASVLAVSGLAPELLELELTESILVRDAEDALQRLHALSRLGVRLAIDDFGTGYSSLGYLKRFPLDKLKIDRSFISGLPTAESDAAIVRAILQMADALGLKVVAEGVETEAQRAFLQACGCDGFQGWLYAPALDALSFEERLVGARSEPHPPDSTLAEGPRIRLVR
jgi:diguanylate cyclase (GGDEF)-like protein